MKIILKKKVEKVGEAGEVKEVKDGYARNYLIPRGLAIESTEANMSMLKQLQAKEETRKQRLKDEAQELAQRLAEHSYTVTAKAGEDDKLFGAVTSQDIADAVSKEVAPIGKKKIQLEEPIKKLGVYQIDIKLHPEVTANIKVWVVKE